MAVCLVPRCDRRSRAGGMCDGHYKRRWNGNFSDALIGELPPVPDGLTDACTERLNAVRLGSDAEAVASIRLHTLIHDLLNP